MAKRASTTTITGNLQNQTNAVNANFDAINTALDNTLSRDGSTPSMTQWEYL
jgi:hypothetical protein